MKLKFFLMLSFLSQTANAETAVISIKDYMLYERSSPTHVGGGRIADFDFMLITTNLQSFEKYKKTRELKFNIIKTYYCCFLAQNNMMMLTLTI